ncbi:RNA polymerase sigma factor [Plantactinospora sonchi]|uniref:SigE family RNA polymerase sigma factor n=1 Tax=Plantactinospora sonchi TaxID=1544735 RepID=A0ABU7RTT7_9ACTN
MADVEDFDEFYRGSRQRLLGYVYLLTGNLSEAQDAVQEAYIRAWQRWSTVRGHDNPEAWVRMVATRVAINRWRSLRSRARAYLRYGVTTTDTPPPDTDTVEVVAALRRLPEEQRTAIALYYLLGMPVAEVARKTGAPVGTVKARLSRGRAALAQLLSVVEFEEVVDA